ncbi:MAG: peptide chain release factor N(5)-glutamine methyltransferase [Kineosporiaceae bacterium]
MTRPALDVPGTDGVRALLRDAAARLASAGVASPEADARALLAHALGVGLGELARLDLLGHRPARPAVEVFDALVTRRSAREPLQHLTGRAGFRGLELAVGPGVFVPRPETEEVAAVAIACARAVGATGRQPLVVDLCTGSAAIALAVADEVPDARVVAVELDPPAVEWARRNIAATAAGARVELRVGDVRRCEQVLLADLAGDVDVVVSNPPYIPPNATPVDPEVRDHDPVLALYGGGDDGLEVPAAVVAAAAVLLTAGGRLVMEHADVQASAARALTVRGPWEDVHTREDLTGRPRMLLAHRTAAPAAPTRVGDWPS